MKLLSVAVPCYNSAAYMHHCIDTLLTGGEDIEILIVNDGSQKDNTAEIADGYQQAYPTICKAVHKENGGHGDAVMHGLMNATGLYFKVVDSDDWVDTDALRTVLDTIRAHQNDETPIDMMVANYVYEKEGAARKHVVKYGNALKENTVLTWDEVGHFHYGQYMLMHSLIYRRQMLIDCGLTLPKKTFYVDNLYAYKPLTEVKTLYYMNVDLYRYFIGRADQSVNESVMISRIDQNILVNKLMMAVTPLSDITPKKKRNYMRNFLEIVVTVSSILLVKGGQPEHLQKKEALWAFIKAEYPDVYKELRYRLLGLTLHLPGKAGRTVMIWAYGIAQKIFGFN